MRVFNLKELAQFLETPNIIGNQDYRVEGITAITSAKDNELCIITDENDLQNLKNYSRDIKAAVVAENLKESLPENINYILVEDALAASELLIRLYSKSYTVVP